MIMAYDAAEKNVRKPHELSLIGRNRLTLSGVEDVSGFDENIVVLTTSMGTLNIRGSELHIERIDLEAGQLELKGEVQELSYDEAVSSGSFFSRLFG